MANICDFVIKIVGDNKDIGKFIKALKHEKQYAVGSTVDLYHISWNKEEGYALINGDCKWGVEICFIHDPYCGKIEDQIFLTLEEASERWNLKIEVFSEETGLAFMEHYIFIHGKMICDEGEIDYREYNISDYGTLEEANEVLNLDEPISLEEWNSGADWIMRGGIQWHFTI